MGLALAAFDRVLMDVYQKILPSQISNKTPIESAFSDADGPTLDGRQIIYPLHVSRNQSAISSAENATLPDAGNEGHTDVHVRLRKIVYRINLTKDVIDASRSSKGAYKRAMTMEMDAVVNNVADYRNERLAGYGTGVLAKIATTGSSGTSHTLTLKDPGGITGTVNPNRFIQVGQRLALIRSGGVVSGGALVVTGVTESGSFNQATVTSSGTCTPTADDLLVLNSTSTNTSLGSTDYMQPLMGLTGLVDDGTYVGTVHGVNRVTYPVFKSFVLPSVGGLSLDAIQRCIDAAETKGNGSIKQFWCEHGVRRAYMNLLEADRRYMAEYLNKPNGGTTAATGGELAYGSIPFKTDRDLPYGMLFGVDPDQFSRYSSSKGEWEQSDGHILFRSANTHDFTALWYMRDNFQVERPNACFRMDGITTTQLAVHID